MEIEKMEEKKESVSKGSKWLGFTEFVIQVAVLVISTIALFK